MSRDEFQSYIVKMARENSSGAINVGKTIRFVESVLRLQNDFTRPVYVFEVSPSISKGDIAYIDDAMRSMGIACVLVPNGLMRYVGEVDSESFGVKNYMDEYVNGVYDGR